MKTPMPANRRDDLVEVLGRPRKTPQGYLKLDARMARAENVQVYSDDEGRRAEYRPESEVFATAALSSFKHAVVTDDHPMELLTPENTARYSKGFVTEDVRRDGEWVRGTIMVTDAALIAKMKAGKVELSAGYSVDLEKAPPGSKTPDGTPYTHVQRNIV